MRVIPSALNAWSYFVLVSINDLPDSASNQLCIYADDTTICSCLDSKSDRFDKIEMEADVKKRTPVCC